jgi:hypothetical protein
MKSFMRSSLVIVGVLLGIMSFLAVVTFGDDPIIQNMDYTPKNPDPLATITFSATVNADNPLVYVFVEECRDDLCYADVQNVTMDKIGTFQYTKDVTLKHGDANIVHYQIIVENNGIWYNSTMEEFNLGTGETNGNGDTPGFEGLFLIAAFVMMVTLIKKRH